MRDVLGPVLQAAVRSMAEPLDVKAVLAQMLQMGDEGHNRNRAGSLMTLRELSPAVVEVDAPSSDIAAVLRFIGGNEHFFLNLGMPTAKLALDAARDVPGSTMVTVMSRNGPSSASRPPAPATAGSPARPTPRWACSSATTARTDANPDIGDSAIMETYGVGGFTMAAAPRSSASSAAPCPTRWPPPSGCTS
jgi:hypothetical protein